MATTSRFERYADARAEEIRFIINEIEIEEAIAIEQGEDLYAIYSATEEEAVDSIISLAIEGAMIAGYFMGMLDGRSDALELGGERFVTGENVVKAIERLVYVTRNSKDACPTDAFITARLSRIEDMPVGLSGEQLIRGRSELR